LLEKPGGGHEHLQILASRDGGQMRPEKAMEAMIGSRRSEKAQRRRGRIGSRMPEREVGMENEGCDRGKDDTSNEGLAPPGERRKDWWKKLGGYQSAESPEQHGAIANGGSEEEPSRDRHQSGRAS